MCALARFLSIEEVGFGLSLKISNLRSSSNLPFKNTSQLQGRTYIRYQVDAKKMLNMCVFKIYYFKILTHCALVQCASDVFTMHSGRHNYTTYFTVIFGYVDVFFGFSM
jgi:hypothetical protein